MHFIWHFFQGFIQCMYILEITCYNYCTLLYTPMLLLVKYFSKTAGFENILELSKQNSLIFWTFVGFSRFTWGIELTTFRNSFSQVLLVAFESQGYTINGRRRVVVRVCMEENYTRSTLVASYQTSYINIIQDIFMFNTRAKFTCPLTTP